MMGYDNIAQVILSAIAIIISFTIHEYSHALASHVQGDDTPSMYGRLSLNPLAHVDPIGLITLFIFKFGWAKPVPIISRSYKNERLGLIFTSIAGPLSNVLLAFLSVLTIGLLNPSNEGVAYFLSEMMWINCGLAVFNLLPFPPLDGSKIFAELFRGPIADLIYKMERFGVMLLFMLLWIPGVDKMLFILIKGLANGIIQAVLLIVGR